MSDTDRNELIEACRHAQPMSDEQMLDIGPTVWMTGTPAPASEGQIALRIGEMQTVILQDSDVVDVDRSENRYFVKVRTGARAVYRFEDAFEVGRSARQAPSAAGCGCGQAADYESSGTPRRRTPLTANAPQQGGGGGGGGLCDPVCWLDQVCSLWVDRDGFVRMICVPILGCTWPCIPV